MSLRPRIDLPVRGNLERVLEQLVDLLNRDGMNEWCRVRPLDTRSRAGYHPEAFRRVTNAVPQSWYVAGVNNGTTGTTGAPAINTIHLIPFVMATAFRLEDIAINVTTLAAGSLFRLGIYKATYGRDGNLYPGELIWQGAETSAASTGIKTLYPYIDLEAGQVYYAAYFVGTLAPTIRCMSVGAMGNQLGHAGGLTTDMVWGYSYALTYTTLPPNMLQYGGTLVSQTAVPIPAIFMRFAAGSQSVRSYKWSEFCPPLPGIALRRARILSPEEFGGTRTSPYVVVTVGLRRGGAFEELATFDSRTDRVLQGEPYYLTGDAELDRVLDVEEILETQVIEAGWPPLDLSGAVVQYDLAFTGGS